MMTQKESINFNRATEIIQFEQQRKIYWKKKLTVSYTCGIVYEDITFMPVET